MAEKQCGKCGEMVDEAKAFCPGCGHSFVDEKQRTTRSDFDLSENTIQLGETMYNQMLSEMGLNISSQPVREEGKVQPPATEALPNAELKETAPAAKRNTKTIWIIAIVIAALVFAAVVVLITVAGLIFYYR